MEFLWFVLIGIAAGWLAGKLMGAGSGGLLIDLIVGVIGAIVGGFLFRQIGFVTDGLLAQLITATFGAMVLIALLRLVNKKKKAA